MNLIVQNGDILMKEEFEDLLNTHKDCLDFLEYLDSQPPYITPLKIHGESRKFGFLRGRGRKEYTTTCLLEKSFYKSLNSIKSPKELIDIVTNKKKFHIKYSKYIKSIASYEDDYVRKKKKALPSLLLFHRKYEYNLICADFDELSNDKTKLTFDKFDDLKDHLRTQYAGKAIFTNGPRHFNSFKMLFVVKGKVESTKQCKVILKQLLNDDDLFKLVDLTDGALRRCYVTNEIYNILKSEVNSVPIALDLNINPLPDIYTVNSSSTVRNSYNDARTCIDTMSFEGTISNELRMTYINPKSLKGGYNSVARENLIRMILSPIACIKLQDGSFNISSVDFAKKLNMSQRWVSKQLSILKKLGLLQENESKGYKIKLVAKSYQAAGLLLAETKNIMSETNINPISYTAPESVDDGNWNNTIKSVTKEFGGTSSNQPVRRGLMI